MDKHLLFSIRGNVKDITRKLNYGSVPKRLREEYEKNGYELSDDEHIFVLAQYRLIGSNMWEFYDEIEEYNHKIRKENGKLNIYDMDKPKEEELGTEKTKEDELGIEKQKEQERTRKSKSPFEINRIKALGIGKNILRSLGLFVIPSILIWFGLDIFGPPPFIIMISLILTTGIIAIIVGIYSGLSSKTMTSGVISGFVATFIGSLIVILLISSVTGAGTNQETEEPIEQEWEAERIGRFFGYFLSTGIIGGTSAALGNSITSNVNIVKNYVCSNCGQENLDYNESSYLFSIIGPTDEMMRNLTDEETPIWEPLKDIYEKNGYPLSEDQHVYIEVVKNGKIWTLYDEIKGYYHEIRKEKERLNIYNKNQCPNCGAEFVKIEKKGISTVVEEVERI